MCQLIQYTVIYNIHGNVCNGIDVDRTSSTSVFDLKYYSSPDLYYHQMNVESRVEKVLFNTGEIGDMYSRDPKTDHSKTGFIPNPDILKVGSRMVQTIRKPDEKVQFSNGLN